MSDDQSQHVGADELSLGYCVRCSGYGRGEYAGPINSGVAIRNHRGCPQPPHGSTVQGELMPITKETDGD